MLTPASARISSASGAVGPLATSSTTAARTSPGVVGGDRVLQGAGRQDIHLERQQLVGPDLLALVIGELTGRVLGLAQGGDVEALLIVNGALGVRYRDHPISAVGEQLGQSRPRVAEALDRHRRGAAVLAYSLAIQPIMSWVV